MDYGYYIGAITRLVLIPNISFLERIPIMSATVLKREEQKRLSENLLEDQN